MASIDLVSNLLPGVLSAEGRRLEQQATPAQTVGQSLLGGIQGLGAVAPAASQQKRNLAGLFGGLTGRDIDVRSPIEKINAQLAQSGVALNTSAGLLEAAKLAQAAGLTQQALELTQMSGNKRKEEEDRELKRKRDQQIIDLSIKEDERADTTEERELAQEARANATLAINQAARLREISQSEARKTAAQDAFVEEFPEDVELAQAVGAGALTLDEARLWKQKGDPQDWPKFLKWAEENPNKGYDEFLQFDADLKKTTTASRATRGISLSKEDTERLVRRVEERFTEFFDVGAPNLLPAGYDKDKFVDAVRVEMENQEPGQQITIDQAINKILALVVPEESTSISPEAKSELEGYGK